MKKISLIALALIMFAPVYAQDATGQIIALDSLRRELTQLKQNNVELAATNESLKKRVATLEGLMRNLQGESEAIASRVTGTEAGLVEAESTLRDAKNGLETQIQQTNNAVTSQGDSVRRRTIWGIIIAFVVLLGSALIAFLLNRKGKAKIDDLQNKAEKLNEEIVNRLSSEVGDIQKIATSLGSLSTVGASSQNEQDLIKALADRITFMEMTLFRMDPSVRGYKQLTKSISQMKDNLKASDYEIVDMLGKPYHEGMKVTANFVEDENVEQGKQIITGIIKPQINYQGQMIQAAQITVSQNI